MAISESPINPPGYNTISDGATATQFEQIDIDGVVNANMLHAHLALLAKFKELEQEDNVKDLGYLLRAERRYVEWLKLIKDTDFGRKNQGEEGKKINEEILIPPIDVAQMWHAHLLSPLRYWEDMRRIHDPLDKSYNFPLEQMHRVWSENGGVHFHERSKNFWVNNTTEPWELDPDDTSPFEIVCPWCLQTSSIPSDKYVKLVRTRSEFTTCSNCNCKLSCETLSVKRLLDDITLYRNNYSRHIGGTLIDRKTGEYQEAQSITNCDLLFKEDYTPIDLLHYAAETSSENCNWPEIVAAIKNQLNKLKSMGKLKDTSQDIVRRIFFAYAGIISPFSIELVPAVLRQREFTHKMLNNAWINQLEAQAQATIRYHKFLLLQKDNVQREYYVPTLDIDLGWHTHMLHPGLYRSFTKQNVHRIINHDDTLSKGTLTDGFAHTNLAWYKKYNEAYTNEDPSKYWLTTKKKVMSVILPPYALYVAWKLKKYRKEINKSKRSSYQGTNVGSNNRHSAYIGSNTGLIFGGATLRYTYGSNYNSALSCGGCGGGGCGGGGCGGGGCGSGGCGGNNEGGCGSGCGGGCGSGCGSGGCGS